MDPLVILVIVGVVAALSFAAHDASRTTEQAFTGYFRGVKPDPWPHGVQEEDDPTPWASRALRAAATAEPPEPPVTTQPVRGTIRAR